MEKVMGLLTAGLLLLTPQLAQATNCPVDLPDAIATHIDQPQWERSRWGIVIQNLESGDDLYRHNAEDYFLPASNAKLLTTAAALNALGPDWQQQTLIYQQGDGADVEAIHITGQGNPTLTTADLKAWARSLYAQGIRTIERLTVSEAPPPYHHPTWEVYDLNFYYGAPVSGLILNENSFRLTVLPQAVGEPIAWETDDAIALGQWQINNQGVTSEPGNPYALDITGILGTPILKISGAVAADNGPDPWDMAVLDPAQYFLDTLRSQLLQAGIAVNTVAVEPREPLGMPLHETWNSPPLTELIRTTNQPSQNLYAEVLLQGLGHAHPSQDGLIALEASLTNLGVDPDSYQLADGSGLSRHNLVSSEAIAQTLAQMAKSEHAQDFLASLPVGGQSGTLRRRFRETPVAGSVWAKTGTLTGVSALSGYLQLPGQERLVFSILLNQATVSVTEQRQAIDGLVLLLADWQQCSTRDQDTLPELSGDRHQHDHAQGQ
ncbi:MAG: D-alanyl-D-alanine carboxypeptidase/D-alanyl-D-alanine-endopeptidase [Spirulina sp. SIO3F2]|nr:D-alanyl-D-alanine carboxypeptidase/D-alanyl-D-alanine-endopeptidase [Spirulina sp. SIO3F2]